MYDSFQARAIAKCAICLEERPTQDARHCRQCDTNCCKDCFREYVTRKITVGDVAPHQLVCPGQCRRPIPRLVLLVVVSTSLFEKYDRCVLAYKQRQTGYWFCPRPECGQMLPARTAHNKNSRRLDCESCQQSSCLDCGGVYHARPTCDVEFRAWCDAHDAQRCPLCTMMLERIDGCHRIECAFCYNEFCWRCGINMNDHRLALCWPRMCMRSNHWLYGPTAPIRFVTKTVFGTVAGGIGFFAGAFVVSIAIVVVPIFDAYHRARYLPPPSAPTTSEPRAENAVPAER